MDSYVLVNQRKINKPHIQMARGYYRVSQLPGINHVPRRETAWATDRWQKAYDFVHRVNEHIGFGGKGK